jgi:hypothetical protein
LVKKQTETLHQLKRKEVTVEVTTKTGVWKITPLVNKTVKVLYPDGDSTFEYNAYGWLYTRQSDGKMEVFIEYIKSSFSIEDAAKWISHRSMRELRVVTLEGEIFPLLSQKEIEWKKFTARYSLTEHPLFRGLIHNGVWEDSYCGEGEPWPMQFYPEGAKFVNRQELYTLWLNGQVK